MPFLIFWRELFLTHSQTVPVKHIFILLLTIYNTDCINEHIRPYSLAISSTVQNKIEKNLPLYIQDKNIIILVHNM